MDPSQALQVLQVVLGFLSVVRKGGTLPGGTRPAAGLGQSAPASLGGRRSQCCEGRELTPNVSQHHRNNRNNGSVCSDAQQLLLKTTVLLNFRNLSA